MPTSSSQASVSAQPQQTQSPSTNPMQTASQTQSVVAQLARPPFPTRKIICDSVVESQPQSTKILNEDNKR